MGVVAGSGGGGGHGGGGGGASPQSQDRYGGGSGGGGGAGPGRGPTVIWNQYGPAGGNMQEFGVMVASTLNQLGKSGQVKLTAYNALTNGPKQT